MKRFARVLCMLLSLSLVLSLPAFAAETAQPRASSYFMKTGAYLEKISSSKFEVWFDVTGTGMMEEIGVKTIKVQKSSDQSTWTTVKTYSRDDYSVMIDTNTSGHEGCVTYTCTRGYYYRALVTFYAKNSSGSGQYSSYTATLYMPAS